MFGTLLETTQNLGGLSAIVPQTHGHDAAGQRRSTAVELGTTNDDMNRYQYDQVGRLTRATQAGQTGGNTVAAKRVDLVYGHDALSTHMDRYADLAGADCVAGTDTVFDQLGRTTDLPHRRADTVFADYDLEWDHHNRLVKVELYDSGTLDQVVEYAYDPNGKLYKRTLDSNADETVDTQSVFVRADDQIALELEKSGTGNLSASNLKTRQLWLPQSVDHHLAQEETSSGDLFWSLPDHFTAGDKTGSPLQTLFWCQELRGVGEYHAKKLGSWTIHQLLCKLCNGAHSVDMRIAMPLPFVERCRKRIVAKADSLGVVVRRCVRCSAEKS